MKKGMKKKRYEKEGGVNLVLFPCCVDMIQLVLHAFSLFLLYGKQPQTSGFLS